MRSFCAHCGVDLDERGRRACECTPAERARSTTPAPDVFRRALRGAWLLSTTGKDRPS